MKKILLILVFCVSIVFASLLDSLVSMKKNMIKMGEYEKRFENDLEMVSLYLSSDSLTKEDFRMLHYYLNRADSDFDQMYHYGKRVIKDAKEIVRELERTQ